MIEIIKFPLTQDYNEGTSLNISGGTAGMKSVML